MSLNLNEPVLWPADVCFYLQLQKSDGSCVLIDLDVLRRRMVAYHWLEHNRWVRHYNETVYDPQLVSGELMVERLPCHERDRFTFDMRLNTNSWMVLWSYHTDNGIFVIPSVFEEKDIRNVIGLLRRSRGGHVTGINNALCIADNLEQAFLDIKYVIESGLQIENLLPVR